MKIGIIGGGVMGLVLAYRLSQKKHRVEVFEASSQIGGLSTWFDYGDFLWDKYYHVILRSDRALLDLIAELGLQDKLYWKTTKTGFLWQGKHVSMSDVREFLTFPVLNVFQKMRLAAGILYSQRIKDPAVLKDLSARQWLTSVFGLAVYQAIWEPLLASKFGVLKDLAPATIIWSTLNRYYSTRQSGDKKESLGHLEPQGLKALLDALAENIYANGGHIHCQTPILAVEAPREKAIALFSDDRRAFFCDRLICSIPTAKFQSVAPHLEGIFDDLSFPRFLGVICLSLVLNRSLSPYYITNLIDRHYPFTGIIEPSLLREEGKIAERHLAMIPRYDVPDSSWFEKTDDEIYSLFLGALKEVWPSIEENLLQWHVHRERIVQALWIDSSPRLQTPRRTQDGRAILINNELSGHSALNNNTLVEIANRYGRELSEEFYGK